MNTKLGFFYLDEKRSRNPYYNLAREEALALNLVSGGYIGGLRFWQNTNSIVLGISDSVEKNVQKEILSEFLTQKEELTPSKSPIPHFPYIARRASGGGTVYQETGFNINFSIFYSLIEKKELFPVKDSYNILLGIVISALGKQNISAYSKGKSDITIVTDRGDMKVSGNAQFRKRDCIVHHGTLILDQKLIELVSEKLPHPPEEPDYRQSRSHKDFISSVPKSFDLQKFKEDLRDQCLHYAQNPQIFRFSRDFVRKIQTESGRLITEKYQNKDFLFQKP